MSIAAQRFLLTILLTMMWSPSFLFIKLAVTEIPVCTVVALRVSIAALLLGTIMLLQGRVFPKSGPFWFHSLLFAFMSSVFPFCMFCYAEQSIDSALAAILNGSTPMFTALLAHLFVSSDRMDREKIVGILLSISGLLLLFWPALQAGVEGTLMGMMAAASGAFSYAVSHVYAKKYFSGQTPYVAPTAQLLVSALLLIPLALVVDQPLSMPLPSATALLGVGGLALFGTFFAFILYYRLLEISGPTAISMTACFFPVGGLLLGYLFLDESLTGAALFASSLILLGIAFVNGLIRRPVLHLEKG
jgi:drug/metabolite transporter (DMT)-like permease